MSSDILLNNLSVVHPTSAEYIALDEAHAAHTYHPLPVVLREGDGAWVTDVDGRRYLDCLAGYSALNFGHGHPVLVAAAREQLERLTLTSRAFHHDLLGAFASRLADLCGMEAVLPMNSGAEAVESAVKLARKWGYEIKGVSPDQANIVVARDNFHGRTISIVSFSSDPQSRTNFGPFTPGFREVPFGDAEALASAIDANTVAVLIEPIQGEAGVLIPPDGYLRAVRDLCTAQNVLFMADEIQSGLGRSGRTFACDHEDVRPDVYILGKALGGGIMPVSAVVSTWDVMRALRPGEHGSTFGGNPLACAVGLAVIGLLETGEFQQRATVLGAQLAARLSELVGSGVVSFRCRGLWAGVDIDPAIGTGREVCEALMRRGVLAKDTHGSTVRLAPPLVVSPADVDFAVDALAAVLVELAH
ncbi:MAG: ornithine--oxo-acid transaminase [Actinomycetota bacterium]|jgi:ornithine--oxo-acid transaminase|nr:ornithine--oxo-acid transaminase [Actinomycetota bacterium]